MRIGIAVLLGLVILTIAADVIVHRAEPILRSRVVQTLSTRFGSRVELDRLNVSVTHGLAVSGEGLRIFPLPEVMAAGPAQPLIAIKEFSFHAGLAGLLFEPVRVESVNVSGLRISIPPRQARQQAPKERKRVGKLNIQVNEIVCDDSQIIIQTADPNKDPKVFELRHIVLRDLQPAGPAHYDATLINAIPRGDIHATGSFGPWKADDPGASPVTGQYTFEHADLDPIKGIAGTLSSRGEFKGQLDRMEVDGTTRVPNFSLDSARHPMPLYTRFHAIVDGTNGDTDLEPVEARLEATEFTCRGAVVAVKGKGHLIDLTADIPSGRLQDFLQLAVETQPVVMVAAISSKSRLRIDPGQADILQRLHIKGDFKLTQIHFTNPAVQDKVDMLTKRAEGKPEQAHPGAEDVTSRMTGAYTMDRGELRFRNLRYNLPGATVTLQGVYSADGKEFDFRGKVRTEAKISQMVASRWKSWLLKVVDPFFSKNGAGAVIPVKITGTNTAPKFGLDLGHHGDDEDAPQKPGK